MSPRPFMCCYDGGASPRMCVCPRRVVPVIASAIPDAMKFCFGAKMNMSASTGSHWQNQRATNRYHVEEVAPRRSCGRSAETPVCRRALSMRRSKLAPATVNGLRPVVANACFAADVVTFRADVSEVNSHPAAVVREVERMVLLRGVRLEASRDMRRTTAGSTIFSPGPARSGRPSSPPRLFGGRPVARNQTPTTIDR